MCDLEDLARMHEGACTLTRLDTPGGGRAKDYRWREEREFPLEHLGTPESWREFYDHWKPIYENDLGYDRLGQMLEYVTADDYDDPVVVVLWSDGKYYLWDGNHRTCCRNILGKTTIHAVVGVLK